MTAYVIIGLVKAREAGYDVKASAISRGMKFLRKSLKKMNKKKSTGREIRSFVGYALSLEKEVNVDELRDVYKHREEMSHYGQALIALAMWNIGEKEKAREAVDSLIDVSWVDEKNRTASFKWFRRKVIHRWSVPGSGGLFGA